MEEEPSTEQSPPISDHAAVCCASHPSDCLFERLTVQGAGAFDHEGPRKRCKSASSQPSMDTSLDSDASGSGGGIPPKRKHTDGIAGGSHATAPVSSS